MNQAVRTDVADAAVYPKVASNLRAHSRAYHALAVATVPCPSEFDTFAASVKNLFVKHYEQLAVELAAMGDTAQEFADQARERLARGISA